MVYIYFQLDKNPRQVKKLSLSSIDINMRIEWNTRSKCWYVLGYVGDDLVLRNTKVIPNQMYSFDLDSEYDIPYRFMITTEYKNYNWDTNTLFMLFEDNMNTIDEGLTEEGYLVDRRMGTTSDTHSKVKLKSEYNNYLFDVVKVSSDAGVTITCVGAVDSFSTIGLPQGRWDFSINGKRHVTADESAMIEMLTEYGIAIADIGNGEYSWSNTTDFEVKIEGYYPYAVGYPLTLNLESNETLRVLSKDDNNWVNRFTVCLSSFVDTVWEVYKTEVSEDYNNLVFRARKSLTGVKPSEEEALLERYKSGLDIYSSSIVDELTGVKDWVLDPANNRIRYIDPSASQPVDPADPSNQYIYWITYGGTAQKSSIEEVCKLAQYRQNSQKPESEYEKCVMQADNIMLANSWTSVGHRVANPAYDPEAPPKENEEKSIPLDVVAQKVISNAANGDVNAKELLNSLNKYDSYAEVEILPLIVDQYKQGLDVYSATIVDELTGVSDWILDPANNQIVYNIPNDLPPGIAGYRFDFAGKTYAEGINPESVCASGMKALFPDNSEYRFALVGHFYQCAQKYGSFSIYLTAIPGDVSDEQKTLPLEVVAQKVISNAESGDTHAQAATTAAADIVSSKVNIDDLIPQFEANKTPK